MDSAIALSKIALEIVRRIFVRWQVFVLTVLVVGLIGILVISGIGPLYSSTMIVTAVPKGGSILGDQPGLLSDSVLNGLGGGAASILLRGSKLFVYEQLLQSPSVAEGLLKDRKLVSELFDERVDPKTGLWRSSSLHPVKVMVYSALGLSQDDISSQPTAQDVVNLVSNMLTITEYAQDQDTLSISCAAPTRTLCHDLLLAVHQQAEGQLNDIKKANAEDIIKFTNAQFQTVHDVLTRQALLSQFARAQQAYTEAALKKPVLALVVSPPTIPVSPSFPRPVTVLLILVAIGVLVGAAGAWLAESRKWTLKMLLHRPLQMFRLTRPASV